MVKWKSNKVFEKAKYVIPTIRLKPDPDWALFENAQVGDVITLSPATRH